MSEVNTGTLPPVPPTNAPSEPLLSVGAITAVVTAIIALAVSFGFKIPDNVQSAILGVIAVVVPIVTALWGRLKVWSPKTVALKIAHLRSTTPGL